MNKDRKPVGWFEIYVTDMNRAKLFYEAMLDVKLEELESPSDASELSESTIEMMAFPMRVLDDCGGELPGACGALCKMDGVTPGGGGTLVYFSCNDCAEDEERAAVAGGQVVKPKFSIGNYGFISMVLDTEGNVIGLHSMQ